MAKKNFNRGQNFWTIRDTERLHIWHAYTTNENLSIDTNWGKWTCDHYCYTKNSQFWTLLPQCIRVSQTHVFLNLNSVLLWMIFVSPDHWGPALDSPFGSFSYLFLCHCEDFLHFDLLNVNSTKWVDHLIRLYKSTSTFVITFQLREIDFMFIYLSVLSALLSVNSACGAKLSTMERQINRNSNI